MMAQELLPDNIRKRINVAAHVDPWQWNWYQYIDPDTGTSKFCHAKLEWWYDDVRHVRPKGVAIQPCEIPPAIKEEQHPVHSAQDCQADTGAELAIKEEQHPVHSGQADTGAELAIKEEQRTVHSAQGWQAELWADFRGGDWWRCRACSMYTKNSKYITAEHLESKHHNRMVGKWMAAQAEGRRPRCGAPPPPPPPPCRREGDFFDGID